MTTGVVHADTGSPRQGWRILLWLTPLTALWTLLIYVQPAIQTSGVPTSGHQLVAHAFVALGLWLGLEGTELTPEQRRTTWLAIIIPYTLWFALAWSGAINGVFRTGVTRFPALPSAILLHVIIGVPLLLTSKRVGQVLDAMPRSWLIALQLYRIFGMGRRRRTAWGDARHSLVARGIWRCADRPVRRAGSDRGRERHS